MQNCCVRILRSSFAVLILILNMFCVRMMIALTKKFRWRKIDSAYPDVL